MFQIEPKPTIDEAVESFRTAFMGRDGVLNVFGSPVILFSEPNIIVYIDNAHPKCDETMSSLPIKWKGFTILPQKVINPNRLKSNFKRRAARLQEGQDI